MAYSKPLRFRLVLLAAWLVTTSSFFAETSFAVDAASQDSMPVHGSIVAAKSADAVSNKYDIAEMLVNRTEIDQYASYDDYGNEHTEYLYGDGVVVYGDTKLSVDLTGNLTRVSHRDGYDEEFGYEEDVPVVGATVTASVGSATSIAKTNGDGHVTLKIPVVKVGTRIKIVARCGNSRVITRQVTVHRVGARYNLNYSDDEDYTRQDYGELDYRESFPDNIVIKPTYKKSKKTKVVVKHATAGDFVKVKIGKKTYKKKIKKSAKSVTLTFKHKKLKIGTKIKASHYNKYKQFQGKAKSVVFRGASFSKGMTKKQLRQVRFFGFPDSSKSGGDGWWNYSDWDGDDFVTWITIYFKRGRVDYWIEW